MNKGSALVAVLFAFFAGLIVGNITASGGGASGEHTIAAAAHDVGQEGNGAHAGHEDEAGPERYKVPVTAQQPSRGPDDALVTIVEVSDFQCPFCNRVEPTIDGLIKEYGNKLRVVWRNNPLPFHRDAGPAHQLAMEAFEQGGSDKFWAMHKKLFENQRSLSREALEGYAEELGLDMTQVKAALDNDEHGEVIKADQAMAKRLGARGTPAFFINGRFLSGAQPAAAFKRIIDDELKRAGQLLDTGVKKGQVYAELTKKGLTVAKPPEPRKREPRRQPDPNAVYKVEVGKSAQKGPDDALVTIVAFSDFQCPFCSRVNPTLKQVEETYGEKVRIVFKHNPLPFHKDAMPAAQLALEAREQGKFWEMHDTLFEHQRQLGEGELVGYAKEVGLNIPKVQQALKSEAHKAEVLQDQQQARSLGASGTPSFFINGRNLRGAQPFAAFKAVIDEELRKAEALVKEGTPAAQVYAKIIEKGATTPQFVAAPEAAGKAAAPDADKVYKIAPAPKAPSKGADEPKVTIYEFSDFQCPFCNRVNPTVKQVLDEYGEQVQVVWRNYPLPFHQNAGPAAEAAMEVYEQAGDAKFWAYHDLLFSNQSALDQGSLIKYAEEVGGVDVTKLKAALESGKHKAAVKADMDAVQKAGARIGTPSFFINGRLLQGAQAYPAFKAAIDRALAEAK